MSGGPLARRSWMENMAVGILGGSLFRRQEKAQPESENAGGYVKLRVRTDGVGSDAVRIETDDGRQVVNVVDATLHWHARWPNELHLKLLLDDADVEVHGPCTRQVCDVHGVRRETVGDRYFEYRKPQENA